MRVQRQSRQSLKLNEIRILGGETQVNKYKAT